ncbi:Uncharacterised protein [Mycoplasmopsis bovigenitalium]|uniref:Uncharacterized protein n=1 Tax=Mycoplasmopsis bovigenitalium TaxID=2112 RepID=A0A449A8P1_9BACT|nr:hypothetical protein [Mycoplasmopsis bovigenitalium]VEU60627.1 Uncharacterised protein [Mycoplasmopsis bovigenitalium]
MKQKFIAKIIKIHWIIFSIFSVAFLVAIIHSSSLIFGYVIGANISFLLFLFKVTVFYKIMSTKFKGYVVAFTGLIFTLAFVGLPLGAILWINKYFNGYNQIMFSPINVFCYIFGLVNIPISIFIVALIKEKKEVYAKN